MILTKKILVIQLKRIGDVLVSTILFEQLRKKYPNHQLHYLIYPESLAVVENNPNIDKVIILDKENKNNFVNYIKFAFKLRKNNYEIVIDAYGKPSSNLLLLLIGAKKRITFSKPYSKLFANYVINRSKESKTIATKAIEHRLQLLEPLGIPFELIKPKIFLAEQEIYNAKKILHDNQYIMISALGSNTSKSYPLEYMASVLDFIAENTSNYRFLLNYFPSQKNEITQLYHLCKEDTKNKIDLDIYENDLRAFLALTSQCKALIGNEGGATNMAKALDIPTFTIFSPLVPKNDWNMFEDGEKNISVHLNDYFTNIDEKLYQNNLYQELYNKFEPKLFQKELYHFITSNLK